MKVTTIGRLKEFFNVSGDVYAKDRLEEAIEKHGKENIEALISEMLFEVLDCEEKGEGFAEFCCQTAKQVIDGVYENLQEIQDEIEDMVTQEWF